ncbi:hypothetical protein K488DRAFT_84450 [Vararia minispora EC-137]|uniref:Uncharacterized protein n=1 Tax=Vararia minispora EC-137 TaxID=1314806 RepID=A0ACB8QR48_9AGAM|nr:hypothetical protein K488DRAFT_84450 [Vararia minispora EC-137]
MSTPIKTPDDLVLAFKKSGEFDRLRKELLAQFQQSSAMESLMARVEDIARRKLDSDERLAQKAPETVHRELLQELDRYPILERALSDVPAFSDPAFNGAVRQHARKILRENSERSDGASS